MIKTVKEMIKVMEHYANGGEIEVLITEDGYSEWYSENEPSWNWDDYEYRIKEYKYPIWFKAISTGLIIRFDDLNSGSVVEEGTTSYNKGVYKNNWIKHTDNEHWIQVKEPKPKEKVTIERWVIEESNIKFIVETSDIDAWLKSFPTAKKK